MTHIIAEPCIGTKDTSCVEVCPVDCIHPTKDEGTFTAAEMLYIDPETCIDCGVRRQCPSRPSSRKKTFRNGTAISK
jgi:NAD-dependent dihydropyrimidine dehydrogenase PreA subunit